MIESLNFRVEGRSDITEAECQDSGQGRCSLPNTATWQAVINQVCAVCLHQGLSTQN